MDAKYLAQKTRHGNVHQTGTILMQMSSRPQYKESAFVMITCEDEQGLPVVEALKLISEVKEIQHTYGNYDIIVKIETDTTQSMKEVISTKIRTIEKIRATTTLISSPILIY